MLTPEQSVSFTRTTENTYHFLCFSGMTFTDYREAVQHRTIYHSAGRGKCGAVPGKGHKRAYKIPPPRILGTQAMQEAAPWEPTDMQYTPPMKFFGEGLALRLPREWLTC